LPRRMGVVVSRQSSVVIRRLAFGDMAYGFTDD
jgi:hypothetical protein